MKEKLDILVLHAWIIDNTYLSGVVFSTLYKINEAMEKITGKITKYIKKEKPLDNRYIGYIGVKK